MAQGQARVAMRVRAGGAARASEAMDGRGRLVAVGYLLVLVLIWGGNYTFIKIVLRDIGPWSFNTIRYGIATVLVLAALRLAGHRRVMPEPGERWPLTLVAVLQSAVITAGTGLALQWIEASRVVLIAYSMPVWALPLGILLLGERPSGIKVLGALLGFIGMALLTNPLAMSWGPDTLPGIAAAVIAVMGWASGAVLYRKWQWRSGVWQQTYWQLLVTLIVLAPFALALERSRPINASLGLLGITLYNSVFPTAVAYWCWAHALARVSATTAGQVLLLAPLFGMLLSHHVLGEALGPLVWAAALCIVAGAWLALRR